MRAGWSLHISLAMRLRTEVQTGVVSVNTHYFSLVGFRKYAENQKKY